MTLIGKTWNWFKSIKIWQKILLLSVLFLFTSSLFLLGTYIGETVGQSEVENEFVGVAHSQPDAHKVGGNTEAWSYYNYEAGKLRTEPYSTFEPNRPIADWSSHSISEHSMNIDPDAGVSGVANFEYAMIDSFTSDQYGTDTQGLKTEKITLEFIDPATNQQFDVVLLKTFISFKLILEVNSQYKVYSYDSDPIWGQYIYAATAEWAGEYIRGVGVTKESVDFRGKGCSVRPIIRLKVANYKVDDALHRDSDYSFLGNAILYTNIADVETTIDTGDNVTENSNFEGDFNQRSLTLYPTVEDALQRTNQLADKEETEIELGDTLYDTVYVTLQHGVFPGFEGGMLPSGQFRRIAAANFFVSFTITSCMVVTFQETVGANDLVITDSFNFDAGSDTNFGDIMRGIWSSLVNFFAGGRSWLFVMEIFVVIIVVILIVAIIKNPAILGKLWRGFVYVVSFKWARGG